MPTWLTDPGVITGVLALVGVVASPFITSKIKRKENGRLTAAAAAQVAESQRVEASERRLREFMDRQAEEITDLHRQLREQRAETEALGEQVTMLEKQALRTAQKYDRVLNALLGLARRVHDGLVVGDVDEALKRTREVMDAIETARGSLFNGHGEKSA